MNKLEMDQIENSKRYEIIDTIIKEIVDQKIQRGEMFSSYDITYLVRAKGETACHELYVRQILYSLMRKKTNYTSEFRIFEDQALPNHVYFPIGADVSSYNPHKVFQEVVQASKSASAPPVP
jgi:hypothetical protein